MLWAGLLTCIPLAYLPNSKTNQWLLTGGVLRMLTAAGTVRVFHPIPFSFFTWKETYSAANVVHCNIQQNVYLNNVHEVPYTRIYPAFRSWHLSCATHVERFTFHSPTE